MKKYKVTYLNKVLNHVFEREVSPNDLDYLIGLGSDVCEIKSIQYLNNPNDIWVIGENNEPIKKM